jgi:glutathione peroxidase
MNKYSIAVAGMILSAGLAGTSPAEDAADSVKDTTPIPAVLSFTMKDIDGNNVPLTRYRGKVILIVNVASKCGNTPQYAPLQAMYDKYAPKGLVILAFPANNFGAQEPGTAEQIKAFCENKYNVKFPLFAKISVKGQDKHPLYQFLTSKETNGASGGEITWNFEKFLVSREGKVVQRFAPPMKPDSKQVLDAVEAELAKPSPQ